MFENTATLLDRLVEKGSVIGKIATLLGGRSAATLAAMGTSNKTAGKV